MGPLQRADVKQCLIRKGLTPSEADAKIDHYIRKSEDSPTHVIGPSEKEPVRYIGQIYNKYLPNSSSPVAKAIRDALEQAANLPPKTPSTHWPTNTPEYIIDGPFWRKMFIVGGYSSNGGCEKHQRLGKIIRLATPEEIRIWKAIS